MKKDTILSVTDFSYAYPTSLGSLPVLENLSFSLQKGEFVSIVGPSGCGKTTLLQCIQGLLSEGSGTILIESSAENGKKESMVGMVFQHHSLFPWRSVLSNITYGLELKQINKKERERIGTDLITTVGLKGFEHYYPYQLSGGMQQRVNVARALAIDPHILLLDEPFASLDAQTRSRMQHELLRILRREKKTTLFVTHDIEESIYLSDRVIVLDTRPGRIKKIVTVPFARPRDLSLKLTPEFLKLEKMVTALVMEEVEA